MKEDLICGVAILLYLVLLYLLTTAFIKTGRAVDRYKMKKKTDKIKVGQRYEHKNYFEDPFERGKHVIKILDVKEGYALYEYEEKLYIRSSVSLEDIVKRYVLITDIKIRDYGKESHNQRRNGYFLQKCRERYMGLYWTFWKQSAIHFKKQRCYCMRKRC